MRFEFVKKYADRALPPSERFFKRHGGKTIFLARFIAVLRVTAAWLAGISRMHWWQFFAWNAAGGIVWAAGVSLLAYWAGKAVADTVQKYGLYGAIGLIVLGAAPMAVAQASPVADTILAQAIDGSSAPENYPAPAFSLTDQHGRAVTLASLHGKVVLLTFLDDTCSVDCPLIAQEFRQAGQLLSADTARVALVAINYNPVNTGVSYIQAFDHQEGMAGVPNWLYLTGTVAQLQPVWRQYAIAPPQTLPAGSMIGHGDYAFVIDQAGHMRQELGFDTGPGTQATKSSFAAELTDAAQQLLGHS